MKINKGAYKSTIATLVVVAVVLCVILIKPDNLINQLNDNSSVSSQDAASHNIENDDELESTVFEDEDIINEISENKHGAGLELQENSVDKINDTTKETNSSVDSSITSSSSSIRTEPSAAFLESLGLTLEESKALVEAAQICPLCKQNIGGKHHLYGRDMNCYDCGEPCKANTCHICKQ